VDGLSGLTQAGPGQFGEAMAEVLAPRHRVVPEVAALADEPEQGAHILYVEVGRLRHEGEPATGGERNPLTLGDRISACKQQESAVGLGATVVC
jgi:hypothetical protein